MVELPQAFPIWAVIPGAVVLIAIAVEVGYRLGRLERRRPDRESESLVSDLTTPAIGLLGLMLAFTFGWAAARFDSRRHARLEEADAIARLFRLSDFLPAGDHERVQELVAEYIRVSLAANDIAGLRRAFAQRESMHRDLWQIAVAAGRADRNSEVAALFVTSVNDVLDAHLNRSTLSLSSRIPSGILGGLLGILLLTLGMLGYRVGVSGSSRSPAMIPLTISVAVVVFLVVDLDRPVEGLMRLRDQALIELQRELPAWR